MSSAADRSISYTSCVACCALSTIPLECRGRRARCAHSFAALASWLLQQCPPFSPWSFPFDSVERILIVSLYLNLALPLCYIQRCGTLTQPSSYRSRMVFVRVFVPRTLGISLGLWYVLDLPAGVTQEERKHESFIFCFCRLNPFEACPRLLTRELRLLPISPLYATSIPRHRTPWGHLRTDHLVALLQGSLS